MPISRRQSWQPWRTKDPTAAVTAEGNLRVRQPVGYQQANDAACKRRDSALQDANALLRLLRLSRRLQGLPDPLRSKVVQPLGLQAANDTVRRRRTGVQIANMQLRFAWRRTSVEPFAIGEIYLTLKPRSTAMSVIGRNVLTLKKRSLATTVASRKSLTLKNRSLAITETDR